MEGAIASAVTEIKDDITLKMAPISRIHGNSSESAAAIRQIGRDIADIQLQIESIKRQVRRVSETQEGAQDTYDYLSKEIDTLNQGQGAVPNLFQQMQDRMAVMEERLLSAVLEVDNKVAANEGQEHHLSRPSSRRTNNEELEDEEDFGFSRVPHSSPAAREDVPKGAKLKLPDPFNGKRGTEAETFMMKMEMYFKEYSKHFTDERKIRATLVNMGEGEPTKWANPLMQKHLNNTSHPYLTSWEAFKGAFLLNFSDPSKRDKAIREINSLKQTGSAQIYASQFRILKEDLDWDETALIDTFKKGLRYNLQRELLHMRISNPDIDNYSLEQVIETAIRADDILQQASALREPHSQPSGPKKDQSGETRTREKKERYPTETFLKRSQEGLCPKCGKKGHTMKKCPEKHYIPDPVLGKKGMENEQKEGEFMGSKN
jgi:hypothetical protein